MIALLAAIAAAAPPPSPPELTTKPPEGVWQADSSGGYVHLQSGLACPARLGDLTRTRVHAFDKPGMDVGCNYAREGVLITVYMTKGPANQLDVAMDHARQELEQVAAARNPRQVSRAPLTSGGMTWLSAYYEEDGDIRSDIHLAAYSGWFLEYRTTYSPADTTRISVDLDRMTQAVRASADPQLTACAGSEAPVRKGKAMKSGGKLRDLAVMTIMTLAADKDPKSKVEPKPSAEPIWCPDSYAEQGDLALLLWRAVPTEDQPLGEDRLTAPTLPDAPRMKLYPDSMAALITGGFSSVPWAAVVEEKGRSTLYGLFAGRPSDEDAINLYGAVLSGRAKGMGGVQIEGDTVKILVP